MSNHKAIKYQQVDSTPETSEQLSGLWKAEGIRSVLSGVPGASFWCLKLMTTCFFRAILSKICSKYTGFFKGIYVLFFAVILPAFKREKLDSKIVV